jgi:hypothetical protein
MSKFIAIFFTIWVIFPACDPGWRYRATNKSIPALARYFELKVKAHYFGSSEVEIQLKNIHSSELIITPLYSFANSLACPGQTLIPHRAKITKASIYETYVLELPDNRYEEIKKRQFDMRTLWGKPGSHLKRIATREPNDNQFLLEEVKVSEIERAYLIQPNETIKLIHYIPTFACNNSTLGYPNSSGQSFELTIPISKETGAIILIVDKAVETNANGT